MTARGPRAPRERFTAGFLNHLRGRRLVVVDEPATAVETSAGHFQAQGFEPYPVDLNQKLASAGSPWVAQAVVIGQRSGLVRGWVNTAIEVTPLALLPFVTRNIPPTLVMVAAQPLPDRSCELLFQPLTSTSVKRALIDSEDDSLASPRVSAAIDAVVQAYHRAGRLIEAGRPTALAAVAKDCPAMPRLARSLTGWRG